MNYHKYYKNIEEASDKEFSVEELMKACNDNKVTVEMLPQLFELYDEGDYTVLFIFNEDAPQAHDADYELVDNYVHIRGYAVPGGIDPRSTVNIKIRTDLFIKSLEHVDMY